MRDEKLRMVIDGIYDFTHMEPGIYRVELMSRAFVLVPEKERAGSTEGVSHHYLFYHHSANALL
jgi:hypothetical protein